MNQLTLAATTRTEKGKGAARKLREENCIPAVLYGPNIEPIMLKVEKSDLQKTLKKASSDNFILGLEIESEKGKETRSVIIKELQTDPLKGAFLHADFHEIAMDKELVINVPVRLLNTPVGVADGGIMQHVRREIAIACLPGNIIDFVELDVSELDIGSALHIEDITLPENTRCVEDGHLTVVVVAAPKIVEEEVEEEEGEGEGEEVEGEEAEAAETEEKPAEES